MSTPSGSAPAEARSVRRRMSLGKYVKRMSSVFRREKSSKKRAEAAPSSAQPETQQSRPAQQDESAKEEGAAAAAPSAAASPPPPSPPLLPAPVARPSTAVLTPAAASATVRHLNRAVMQQERARALFSKYGLTLESNEWITSPTSMPTVQRVEKPVRMRVHRSCHQCGTMYGLDKVCLQCEHKRCKKCPRHPRKKTPADKGAAKEDVVERPTKKRVLTITTRSGRELAYQPAKQRIRRTCHKCDALFIPHTATVCENCRHVRCTKCPRDPPKLHKWTSGYPGDMEPESDSGAEKQLERFRRTWRQPRQRVRWECEQCHRNFISGYKQCAGCGHERCDKCIRCPTKKVKKEQRFDPELVAAVEAKLRALGVDNDYPSSAPEAA